MTKIFVTGATGVLGRRVVPALVHAGHDVAAVARTDAKAVPITNAGATAVTIDLFDPAGVQHAVAGFDAVVHLATKIPTGASVVRRGAWKDNDRLRTAAAANVAAAVIELGIPRYIGESITFPYNDAGSDWIDESGPRSYDSSTQSCADAEAAAASVTEAGLAGVSLRFAMFHAADSAHIASYLAAARRGFSPFFGPDDGHVSFIDSGDAAAAVVAALDAPAGIYNVAEADPRRRADHIAALADACGRSKLRATPRAIQRAGGKAVEMFSRSQRIGTTALRDATGWRPLVETVTRWKDLA